MGTVTIDCSGVLSEAEFWSRYVAATSPADKELFGQNLDAFWDAVEGGGPGWPGDFALVFKNTATLAPLRAGYFLTTLKRIASEATMTSITIIP